jgi:hypothetical protein
MDRPQMLKIEGSWDLRIARDELGRTDRSAFAFGLLEFGRVMDA